MRPPLAWYREFLPCTALQGDVYAFFSFVPDALVSRPHRPLRLGASRCAQGRALLREIAFVDAPLCAPQFADGHVSVTFELGQTCDVNGRWYVDAGALRGTIVGPMSAVGRIERGDLPATVGAFFRPARVAPFLRVPISDLTDCTATIDDVWGTASSRLAGELCEMDEAARIDRLESELLARLGRGGRREGSLDVEGLAASVIRQRGRCTVDAMARSAGVSRQHLSREFRERVGVPPKLYTRLVRLQSGLVYAGSRARLDWAGVAIDMGYTDQSHMIAEFREFTGLTPQELAGRAWFHPFIERARSDRWATAARDARTIS